MRAPRLLHELAVSRGDGSYARLLAKLAKLDLLAIDDWLLAPLTDAERRDLLEVIEDRSERKSTLVAMLADDGKLKWDDKVHDHLDYFRLADEAADREVTLRDLLCHRTGMPRHDLAAWRLDLPRAEFVKRMRHLPPSATFREKFQYNNLMYYATAHLVETIAGQRWEEFVKQRIFVP